MKVTVRTAGVVCFVLGVSVFCASVARAEFRLGIIGCDTSHTVCFAKIANVDKDPRVAGFRVTCVPAGSFDRGYRF